MKKQPHPRFDIARETSIVLNTDIAMAANTNWRGREKAQVLAKFLDGSAPVEAIDGYLHRHSKSLLKRSGKFQLGKLAFLTVTHPALQPQDIQTEPDDLSYDLYGICYREYFRTIYGEFDSFGEIKKRHEPFRVNYSSFTDWIANLRALAIIFRHQMGDRRLEVLQKIFLSTLLNQAIEMGLQLPARYQFLLDPEDQRRLEIIKKCQRGGDPVSEIRVLMRKRFPHIHPKLLEKALETILKEVIFMQQPAPVDSAEREYLESIFKVYDNPQVLLYCMLGEKPQY